MGTPTACFLLGVDASVPAPFPTGKLGTPHDPGELFNGVTFPDCVPLDQDEEHGFDVCEPVFQSHGLLSHLDFVILALFLQMGDGRLAIEHFLEGVPFRAAPQDHIP